MYLAARGRMVKFIASKDGRTIELSPRLRLILTQLVELREVIDGSGQGQIAIHYKDKSINVSPSPVYHLTVE